MIGWPTVEVGVVQREEPRIEYRVERSRADRAYRGVVRASGIATLVIMALIGIFLLSQGLPALKEAKLDFLTETKWNPNEGTFGIAAILTGSVLIALVALSLAVPVAIAGALFVTEYAPRRLRGPLTSTIDLLAAVPSLIYGLWGRFFLQPRLVPLEMWLSDHLGFIPIFHTTSDLWGGTTFIAGVVVALMIVPIATAVIREVFSQAPPGEKEGALALGGTRWGMIRSVVIPFGRGGIVGGSMLGLGRALGETIAVALIISPINDHMWQIIDRGGNSIASLIANRFSEASDKEIHALMAAGLALFLMTLVVNAIASVIVSRSRSGAATEI